MPDSVERIEANMREFGQRLADGFHESSVGLVGLVGFSEYSDAQYHNYAWQTIRRLSQLGSDRDIEDWEAAFVLFGITRCVAGSYADQGADDEQYVWPAIAAEINHSKLPADQVPDPTLSVQEQSTLGNVYRKALRRFRFAHPEAFGLEGQTHIGPMLFHAGFAGATIKPVVGLIRRAQQSLKGFDNTSDSDVRRQWITPTNSPSGLGLHSWPEKMLGSYVPAVDDLWQCLVSIVSLRDESTDDWTVEDLEGFGFLASQTEHLLAVLNEGRPPLDPTRSTRTGVQARLYFGHADEAPCPRLFIGNDVIDPKIEQFVGSGWIVCDGQYTRTRLGEFVDFDTAFFGTKLRLLDGEHVVRTWNLTCENVPAIVFSRVGGVLIDAKKVDGAGLFPGERLVLFRGTPEFSNLDAHLVEKLDLLWRYHDPETKWTAWKLEIPNDEFELRFTIGNQAYQMPISRDRNSPIYFRGEACQSAFGVSQDGQTMSLYAEHPIVEQNGAKDVTVVCDIEGRRFRLHRHNYRQRLPVVGGKPLTTGAGIFQIRRLQFPQPELARYAVIPGINIESINDDVQQKACFRITTAYSSGVMKSQDVDCKLSKDKSSWIFETPRDQPFRELVWQPQVEPGESGGHSVEPVRLRISVPGIRWRLVSRLGGERNPYSQWSNRRLPLRQSDAIGLAMELDICVPNGWKLIVQDQAMNQRPRSTPSGDIYRLRLQGQERPTFETTDGTTYNPAIISAHPLISSICLEKLAQSPQVKVIIRGQFLAGTKVWFWPARDLRSPAECIETQAHNDACSFIWPCNGYTDSKKLLDGQCFSFILGREESDGLFNDVMYARTDSEGMLWHPGWRIQKKPDGYCLDPLADTLATRFHPHRILKCVVGNRYEEDLTDAILMNCCEGASDFRCGAFTEFDTPDSAIPWQYLSDLILLRDELKPDTAVEERHNRHQSMKKAADRIFDFHDKEKLTAPYRVMPAFFARICYHLGVRSVAILGWNDQNSFRFPTAGENSDANYYDWLKSLGLTSIHFERSGQSGQPDDSKRTCRWDRECGKVLIHDDEQLSRELPGLLEFTSLPDAAIEKLSDTLRIAESIQSQINENQVYDALRVQNPLVPREIAQTLLMDCPEIHERVRMTAFPDDASRDPHRHVAHTVGCIWSLSWAIAQATTGNLRYRKLLHEAGVDSVMKTINRQKRAFRVAIALAALLQAVVNDGGLGCAVRFQQQLRPGQPR
jgi:hypothetical protein